jgi:hypothetical protein
MIVVMPTKSGWSDDLGQLIAGLAPAIYTFELPLGSARLVTLTDAINQGIDPYLEAVFFDPPIQKDRLLKIAVQKRSLGTLVRRLMEMDTAISKELAEEICGKIGIGLTSFWRLDEFLRAYITCAFFTWTDEEEAPGGCDYRTTGCAERLFEQLAPETLHTMAEDCRKFQIENEKLLVEAGDTEQNGHDFWYTRGGHGVGFWARGYPKKVGNALSEACRKYGECNLYRGDDGKIYIY